MCSPPFPLAASPAKIESWPALGRHAAPHSGPKTVARLPPPAIADRGSRRRKLWELEQQFHCPLIGVCFDVDHLRKLLSRHFDFPRELSDFKLHTSAVGACGERSQLAEVLQKDLEKRLQLSVRRFAAAKSSAALRELWSAAVRSGNELPGALWACWTHPACDRELSHDIYGEIHMIQHQIGGSARADLGTLNSLRAENQRLREQLDAARGENESLRSEKVSATQTMSRQIAEQRSELAGREATIESLRNELDALRQTLPDLRDRQALARRLADSESRLGLASARSAELEKEVDELGRRLQQALAQGELSRAETAEAEAELEATRSANPADLGGKCVLCVGGRTAAVDNCRQLIEIRGGRFMHHDGGREESLHRIDAAVAAADLVICQAGCISHSAYWRVKEQCKRTGKRCLYIKTTGISGLSRLIDASAPEALATEP